MSHVRIPARLRRVGVLALVLAAAGCGGGHSSSTTGPSASSSGAATPAGFDFGANNPRVATAFGDSITFGVLELRTVRAGLSTSNNYPNILQGTLQGLDPGWRVVNRGQPGEPVESGANRIGGVLNADHPGVVLIMEGTNNASRGDDAGFIVANLQTMVNRAKANKTIPILGTIPPNFRNDPGAQDTIAETNPLIRSLASSEGIVLAEIFDGMNDRSLFGVAPDRDPLHPNEQGYQVMANIWFSAIKRAIPGGGTTVALHPKKK